ncbi:MAG: hypothetical protein LBS85_04980, partial [Clostridiales Family XIII bacterium]|nr:hypothetical protein [Clostridiales Family XIII bacterium]
YREARLLKNALISSKSTDIMFPPFMYPFCPIIPHDAARLRLQWKAITQFLRAKRDDAQFSQPPLSKHREIFEAFDIKPPMWLNLLTGF